MEGDLEVEYAAENSCQLGLTVRGEVGTAVVDGLLEPGHLGGKVGLDMESDPAGGEGLFDLAGGGLAPAMIRPLRR